MGPRDWKRVARKMVIWFGVCGLHPANTKITFAINVLDSSMTHCNRYYYYYYYFIASIHIKCMMHWVTAIHLHNHFCIFGLRLHVIWVRRKQKHSAILRPLSLYVHRTQIYHRQSQIEYENVVAYGFFCCWDRPNFGCGATMFIACCENVCTIRNSANIIACQPLLLQKERNRFSNRIALGGFCLISD